MQIKVMSQDIFDSLKDKEEIGFLGKDFDTPIDFETNYNQYFKKKEETKGKFHIVYSKIRENLSKDFQMIDGTGIKKYFGKQSLGKSIILIGSLKYSLDHSLFKSFYINCKALDYYSKINPCELKQIILDEIIYLFYANYELYSTVAEEIKKFELNPNDKQKNFWSLLLKIISFIPNKKYQIIAFDQYNSKYDPFNQLKDIWKFKVNNELHNMSIIVISSLNSDDIKEYKYKIFIGESLDDDIPTSYNEINDIVDPQELIFDDKETNEKLKYIGKNFDNFNEIKKCLEKNEDPDFYLEKKKKHIKERIYDLFGINEKINITTEENIYKFLSLSVDSKYSENEFSKIYKNIPLKYFTLNKEENEDNFFIKINYSAPVVQDIFEEIYSLILLRKDFNNIFNRIISGGGARGIFFEKIVIHNFTPGEHNSHSVNFFDDFLITKTYSIPKFITKDKEKTQLPGNNIINVANKPFILKQKIFGGKALDFVIVKYFGKYAEVFSFQITVNKKLNALMTYKEIEANLETMKKYFKNFFKFEIISIYFAYILDYNRISEKKVEKMCDNLNKEKIKYIFYGINNSCYYSDLNKRIFNIRNNMNEFIFNNSEINKYGIYQLNKKQKLEIINILKKIYKVEKVSFSIFNSSFLNLDDLKEYGLFCIAESKTINGLKTCMYYHIDDKFNSLILKEDGSSEKNEDYFIPSIMFNKTFDYYKIINE